MVRNWHRISSPLAVALLCLTTLLSGPATADLDISRGSATSRAGTGAAVAEWTYTLKVGETLVSVAQELLAANASVQQLASYNRVQSPSSLKSGDAVRIPVAWLRQQPEPARVKGISGQVQSRRASVGGIRPLAEGDLIRAGDTVITRDGTATVELADGSVVRVNPGSEVVFSRLTRYGRAGMIDTRIRLERGGVSNRVQPMVEEGARFEIETPSAVAAVRGTAFALQTDPRGSRLQVTEGKVAFGQPGAIRDIPAGYGAAVSARGDAPMRILRLPPAPQTLPVQASINSLPLDFAWQDNGADRYQVDILEADSGRWVRREQTRSTNIALGGLPNGKYRLEVAALGSDGTVGMPASTAVQVDLAARAAELVEPSPGAALDTDRPRFRWRYTSDSERARVEIASDSQFSNLVASSDWSTRNTASPNRPLKPGQYYWRVVTEAGGNSVATSESRGIVINGTLPPVRILSANYLDHQVRIFWESIENTTGYLLQLSEDPSFEDVVKEATVDDTTAALRLIPGRRYFVRLRAVSDGPMAGRWGPGRELFVE